MSSLRITGGTLRGRRIPVPRGEVRPTSERARQAYFNIIGGRIEGARFLDLFAGSGIFSFEALSRGAAAATAIDHNVTGISRLAARLGVAVNAMSGDVLTVLRRVKEPFDLVYADPPYDYERYDELVTAIQALPLPSDAVVGVEHRRRTNPFTLGIRDSGFGIREFRTAEYGEVWITFFKPSLPQDLQ